MPQMAPINWMLMFLLFILTYLMFNILNYYIFNINFLASKKKINKTINLTWKW